MSAFLKLLKGSKKDEKKEDPVILGSASMLLAKGAKGGPADLADLSKPIEIGEKKDFGTRDRVIDEHRKSLRRNSQRRSHTVNQEIKLGADSGNADALVLQSMNDLVKFDENGNAIDLDKLDRKPEDVKNLLVNMSKRKSSSDKPVTIDVVQPSPASEDEAKKKEEEEAAKKKQQEEEEAKKKQEEEAAALKKKEEEEAAALKKKQEEEEEAAAAALKKKQQDEEDEKRLKEAEATSAKAQLSRHLSEKVLIESIRNAMNKRIYELLSSAITEAELTPNRSEQLNDEIKGAKEELLKIKEEAEQRKKDEADELKRKQEADEKKRQDEKQRIVQALLEKEKQEELERERKLKERLAMAMSAIDDADAEEKQEEEDRKRLEQQQEELKKMIRDQMEAQLKKEQEEEAERKASIAAKEKEILDNLRSALAKNSIEMIRQVIIDAEKAKIKTASLDEAVEYAKERVADAEMEELKKKEDQFIEALKKALQSKNIEALKKTVEEIEALKLKTPALDETMDYARSRIEQDKKEKEEERKRQTQLEEKQKIEKQLLESLKTAIESKSLEQITRALDEVDKSKLKTSPLDTAVAKAKQAKKEAEEAIKKAEEAKKAAEDPEKKHMAAIQAAMEKDDIDALEIALNEADKLKNKSANLKRLIEIADDKLQDLIDQEEEMNKAKAKAEKEEQAKKEREEQERIKKEQDAERLKKEQEQESKRRELLDKRAAEGALDAIIDKIEADYDPNFKEVNLCDKGITSKDMEAICNAMKSNKTVEILDVRNNKIDDNCCKAIKDMILRNKALTTLDLDGNPITGKTVDMVIVALENNEYLTEVVLGEAATDDDYAFIDQYLDRNFELKKKRKK